jgi:sugar lactone lactonase YvrE
MHHYALSGDNVFPEGITEGPGSTFFVGSLGTGAIYVGDATTGQTQVLLPPADDGRKAIAGLDVDGYGRLIACDIEGAALYVFDLDSRHLVARRAVPAPESWPNDVVVVGDDAYITDTKQPVIWHLPVGPGEIGHPQVAIDLARFGPANPAYLNGIVAHPDGTKSRLLFASQGEGGTLWLGDPASGEASPVDLGGYEFNADGMLLDGDIVYGVTNRGETHADARFMISAVRLAADWQSGQLLGELTDPAWDCPTTIAKVDGKLLIVCSQVVLQRTGGQPSLPFEVIGADFPDWPAS